MSAGRLLVSALRDPDSLADPDWSALIAAARAEQLLGSLAERLRNRALPRKTTQILAAARRESAHQRTRALWEAEMARRALAPLGVPVVLLKGTAFHAANLTAAAGRSITEVDKGERVKIPSRDISEPTFSITQGGRRESIHPGNREFVSGDRVPRPGGGQGGRGGKASNTGQGEDDFVFELSRDEFLDLLFEDLELPHLVKKELTRLPEHKLVRAGFTTDGTPSTSSLPCSARSALPRTTGVSAPGKPCFVSISRTSSSTMSSSSASSTRSALFMNTTM